MPTTTPADGPAAEAVSQARRLWFAAAAAALAYGMSLRDAPHPDQAAAKVLLCALLILASARHAPARERFWLISALVASAAGDALLALPQLSLSFIGGLGAFLLAHIAYCALLAPLAGRPRGWQRVALPVLWAAALGMYVQFLPRLGALALPVAAYMVALCLMASFAVSARLPGASVAIVAIGGLGFVVSDAMIGTDRFIAAFTGSAYAIWATYAFAQLSLVGGILLRRRSDPEPPSDCGNESAPH
jgi:uncharacterized membrane protein YhhN